MFLSEHRSPSHRDLGQNILHGKWQWSEAIPWSGASCSLKAPRGSKDQNFPLDKKLVCFTFILSFCFYFFLFPQMKWSSCSLPVHTCPRVAGMLNVSSGCAELQQLLCCRWWQLGVLRPLRPARIFQVFPSAPCRAPSPDLDSESCSGPPAAWLLEVCLRCCSRTGVAGLPAALLWAGEQPSRSLSGVSWNQCYFHKTLHMQQGFLIELHLVAGKSLRHWCGAVRCIPRVCRAHFAGWEGVLSHVPAVGSEQPVSSLP